MAAHLRHGRQSMRGEAAVAGLSLATGGPNGAGTAAFAAAVKTGYTRKTVRREPVKEPVRVCVPV